MIYKYDTLPLGWYVDSAYVEIQATEYADVMVRGYEVGRATDAQSNVAKRFNIDPDYFGAGGSSLSLSFLAQNYNLSRPSVTAKFTISRCQP